MEYFLNARIQNFLIDNENTHRRKGHLQWKDTTFVTKSSPKLRATVDITQAENQKKNACLV